MCEYSLHNCETRPAVVADELVSGAIVDRKGVQTLSRGFHEVGKPDVAVCLRPGTELGFAKDVEFLTVLSTIRDGTWMETGTAPFCTAIFRQLNTECEFRHHDHLEFPDGSIVPLTYLIPGQRASVLQLPAVPIDEPEVKNASLKKSAAEMLARLDEREEITPF